MNSVACGCLRGGVRVATTGLPLRQAFGWNPLKSSIQSELPTSVRKRDVTSHIRIDSLRSTLHQAAARGCNCQHVQFGRHSGTI